MNENILEALFRQAIIDDYKEEIEKIPDKKELMKIISLSPEFELRMNKLFARDRRRDIFIKVVHYSKRVAVVIILAVTILSIILLANTQVRASVKNAIVEWYEKYTSIIFKGKESSDTDTLKEFKLEYIPEGYTESWIVEQGNIIDIEYENNIGDTIYISYWPDSYSSNISIDNENHIIESKTIKGYKAYFAEATNDDFENGIVCIMEGYRFNIWSKLPIKELIKIVESATW